jgi:hypothetical protein
MSECVGRCVGLWRRDRSRPEPRTGTAGAEGGGLRATWRDHFIVREVRKKKKKRCARGIRAEKIGMGS